MGERGLNGLFDSRQTRAAAAAAVATGGGYEEDLDMGVGKGKGKKERKEREGSITIYTFIHTQVSRVLARQRKAPENYAMVSLSTHHEWLNIYICIYISMYMLFITVKYSHQ